MSSVGKILSYIVYSALGFAIGLALLMLVLRTVRKYGGSVGATVAAGAANLTGTNV